MPEIALLKFGHILCLAYWLGADLGVFYSSFFVVDDKLSAETRINMAKLLFALDQGPRMCMPLMLGFGGHLASAQGWIDVSGPFVALGWAICLGWLAMVVILHRLGPAAGALAVFDYGFRVVVIALLGSYAVYALISGALAEWLAWKLLIFAGLIASGLVIRRKLRPFGPAFAALVHGRATDADNAAIRESLSSSRPFVIAIWVGILFSTALGIHLL